MAQQKQGVERKASGEEGVNIIAALLGLGELVTNVNLPNRGQVAHLPLDAIVETNAFITRNRVQPIVSGALPKGVEMLAARHVSNQEAVAEAGLTKDRGLAFKRFSMTRLSRSTAVMRSSFLTTCFQSTSRYYNRSSDRLENVQLTIMIVALKK